MSGRRILITGVGGFVGGHLARRISERGDVALGVGIGIGLQSVVASFVAGLILLLERRIHVGDSIETGDLQGEVREIGFRASTIRTYNGAEVIVPNGRLTSERVTNWTLTDRMRRVDLRVAVAYASDPALVLDALHAAAKAYPKALAQPAPLALCTGFRDSALNFELRVWTASFEESDLVRSDLAVAMHAALAAASIEIAIWGGFDATSPGFGRPGARARSRPLVCGVPQPVPRGDRARLRAAVRSGSHQCFPPM